LVEGLLSEPSRLRAMADNGRKLRRLDAADAILQDVQHVLGGEQPKAGPKPNASRQASGERGAAARRGGVA
jgi:hypothetical protein